MPRSTVSARSGLLLAALVLGGCAHLPADDPADPLESVNRKIYTFNEIADHYVMHPVATTYDKVMPGFARTGVKNFFSNLFYPTVIVNDALQLKGQMLAQDFCRFVLNSTFGVAGLIDVATPGGLPVNREDFGQTLGYWGVGEGWYIVLPFLGPSNNRDLVGRVGDYFTNPTFYLDDEWTSYGLTVLDLVDLRARLLPADHFLEQQIDRYVFVRTAYLQDRQNKVYDGSPPKEDYGFEDEDTPAAQ
jgi:phospholipid-binding lipoprotein MlaA